MKSFYATKHKISPPWPAARAARSLIRPLDVETIATPSPPMTLGRFILATKDPPTGLAHPVDTLDDRPTFKILQGHGQIRLARVGRRHRKISNITLVAQHLGNRRLDLGGRHGYLGFCGGLGIADARQHIRDGVRHTHNFNLLHGQSGRRVGSEANPGLKV